MIQMFLVMLELYEQEARPRNFNVVFGRRYTKTFPHPSAHSTSSSPVPI